MAISVTYNSDCLPAMREMPDKAFSLAIVDPPFGINRSGQRLSVNNRNPQHNRKYFEDKGWDSERPTREYFNELRRVSVSQIIWGGNYFADLLPASRGWLFWDKGQEGLSMSDGELAWTSFDCPLRKTTINRNVFLTEQTIHPTQKPVRLMKWCLTLFAQVGDTVLDTHLGSGSSRVAAYDLGFDFTGYELDKDYFDAQERRFADHIAQGSLFEPVAEPEQGKLCD